MIKSNKKCELESCSDCVYNPISEMYECRVYDCEVDDDFDCEEE